MRSAATCSRASRSTSKNGRNHGIWGRRIHDPPALFFAAGLCETPRHAPASKRTSVTSGPAAPLDEAARERLRAVHATLTAGDPARAAALAAQAVADGIEHPLVLSLAAGRLEELGRPADALPLLLRARELAPAAPGILNTLGLCLQLLDRHEEAVEAFEAAIAIMPDLAPAHANRGESLVELARLVEAGDAYRTALALDPALLTAIAGLAALAVRRGDYEEGGTRAAAVLAREPGYPPALLALAQSAFGMGELAAAEGALGKLAGERSATPRHRAIARSLLGDLRDRQGRFADAYRAYEGAGAAFRAIFAPAYARRPAPQMLIGAMAEALTLLGPAPPVHEVTRADRPRSHVFLIGFPRSGTTLLEQVLEQHPDAVTLGERDCLAEARDAALGSAADFLAFARRPDAALEPFRERYWQRVAEAGIDPGGRVFVDKHPFHSFYLPLIVRLFPDAIILLALRDPRDVVLSCFRRRFQMNEPNYQLLTLEGAASLYDATMRLVGATLVVMRPPLLRCRLEDLIADFDGETRRLCAALDLAWTPELAEFAGASAQRGVATPSGPQLARGLNAEGVGRWRDYAGPMTPVLPALAPWIDRFGYA